MHLRFVYILELKLDIESSTFFFAGVMEFFKYGILNYTKILFHNDRILFLTRRFSPLKEEEKIL